MQNAQTKNEHAARHKDAILAGGGSTSTIRDGNSHDSLHDNREEYTVVGIQCAHDQFQKDS
jgi:hypothetical protein